MGQNFFWVHFLPRSYVHFLNHYEKMDFLIPHSKQSPKNGFYVQIFDFHRPSDQCCGSGSGIRDRVPFRPLDQGWRQFGSGIRDGKKSDPGSGINIPDPQHCFKIFMQDIWASKSLVPNVHPPWQNPRYAPDCYVGIFLGHQDMYGNHNTSSLYQYRV